jgi:hypothetical protein
MANFVKAYSGVVVAGELHSVANIAQTSKLTLEATSTLDARDFAFMRDQMPYLVDLDITAAAIVEYEGPDGTVSGSPLYYAADKVPQESFKGKLLVTAKLPASATLIGESAFRNTTALAEAEIPAAVTIIESYAFDGSGIAHVAFANNAQLTAIGAHAFENAKLTGLNLPTELLTIGDYAFSGCTELAGSLTIPAKVSSIGACAFAKNELSNSSFNKLSEVIFPASLRTIGAHAFRNSKSLESIRIEEGLESIGEYAFGGCSRLKGTLVIPSTMTSVAHDAFASDSIQYLELHAGITALGDWAFANNPFDSVRVYSPTPLALNAQSLNPFSGVNSSSDKRPLLVPEGSYSAYLNAAVWSTFELGSDNLMFEDNIDYGNRDWRVEAAANPPAGGSVGDSSEVRGMPDWIRTANDYDTDEYYYIAGQTAKLKATPAAGYAFVSWTADGSSDVLGTDAVLSYVVTGRAKLIANFTPLYRVTVIANNDEMGTVAGSGDYRADSTASILATPNDSYRFVQWNDGSTDSLRTVTVTQNVTYTAEFAVDMSGIFHVTVSANSNEMGTVSGGGDYRADSTASISATPNAGYRFEQWSDGNTNNPRTVTVTQDMSFTAMFAAIMYTLSVAANDPSMGTVSGGDSYRADSAASISATPNAGYRFERWSDGNTNNPRTVRVTQDTSFTAEFAAIMYTLSVAANDPSMGTVSGSGGYRADSAASISATPNAGYRFERWSDGNTDNPRTVTVTQDASFTAEFAAIMYILSVAANNDEMGTVAGSGDYRADSTASISATPGAGYRFAQWSDGNIDNPRRVRVTQDTSFTAEFAVALLSYQLTAVAVNPSMGTVSGGGTYTEGAVVSINATANAGYRFVRWSDGNTDNPRMVTVTQNITCTAEFASTTTDVEGAEALTISVYPNPAVDYIAVVLPENAARAFFTLYDMQGQVAIEKAIGRREAISVSHLPAGIYIYEVAIEKQRYTGRLVKN